MALPRWRCWHIPAYQCRRRKRHGLDPWVGKIPWKRAWQLQSSCLENPMDRRALWATVCRVAKCQMWLKRLSTLAHKMANICQISGFRDQVTSIYFSDGALLTWYLVFFVFSDFICWLIFGCAGSLLLRGLFSPCDEQGLLSSLGAWTSCGGFSCCGARA